LKRCSTGWWQKNLRKQDNKKGRVTAEQARLPSFSNHPIISI